MKSLYEVMPSSGSFARSSSVPPVMEVGDRDVEADVDHRRAALDLLVVLLERLGERVARRLDAEVDQRRRAAECGRGRAGREVVAGRRPAEEHLEVRVRVDRARASRSCRCASITLSALTSSEAPSSATLAVVDEDVADVVVGRGDDAAALDQHGHPACPPFDGVVRGVYDAPRRGVKPKPAAAARASRSSAGTRARRAARSPRRGAARSGRARPGSPSTNPHGTLAVGSPRQLHGELNGISESR